MKIFKKVFALLLIFTICFSLQSSAYAALSQEEIDAMMEDNTEDEIEAINNGGLTDIEVERIKDLLTKEIAGAKYVGNFKYKNKLFVLNNSVHTYWNGVRYDSSGMEGFSSTYKYPTLRNDNLNTFKIQAVGFGKGKSIRFVILAEDFYNTGYEDLEDVNTYEEKNSLYKDFSSNYNEATKYSDYLHEKYPDLY